MLCPLFQIANLINTIFNERGDREKKRTKIKRLEVTSKL